MEIGFGGVSGSLRRRGRPARQPGWRGPTGAVLRPWRRWRLARWWARAAGWGGSRRPRYHPRQPWVGVLALLLLAAASIGLTRFWVWADRRLMDSVLVAAESRVRALASEMVSRSVAAILEPGTYGSFVRVVQNRDGQAAYLLVDSLAVSRLQLEVALRIQEALRKLEATSISIPTGQLLGIPLWAARGPEVPVKILPVGNVEVAFYSEFREAGINQSLHQIGMEATAVIRLVLPRREEAIRWQIRLPLGEAVLVGQVPSVYAAGTAPWLGVAGMPRQNEGGQSGGGISRGSGAGGGISLRGPVVTLPLDT
ncbi:MAG: sporulation protein YunB [Limnochordales bacterium]|nr:sporulation protein YunB [Limnochordales bacterium]